MLGIVIVNHNTSALTLECVRSVRESLERPSIRVILIDSGSEENDLHALRSGLSEMTFPHELLEIPENVGFAAACNRGIGELMSDRAVTRFLLLNNDAVLEPKGLYTFSGFASSHPEAAMVAGRMHQFSDPVTVDSLGIAFYASVLASNRKSTEYRLLGPSGGLGIYSRELLQALLDRHGYLFDERFFCYAEDTDLAFRALLLGFEPGYCDTRVALHHGQASSGGGFNDFVLYHGIRNSIWTATKCLPWPMLLVMAPLAMVLHVAIVIRHLQRGKGRILWQLYRDAARGLPAMWRDRRIVLRHRVVGSRQMWRHVSPHFYDRQYLRTAWRELWRGRRRTGPKPE